MYKLAFFVPVEDAESVKQAVFEAGAGRVGAYENVCFQTRGTGQLGKGRRVQSRTALR